MPAARPIWKGHIRLSLVSIPVELFTATKTSEKIAFRQIHEPTGKPIHYQKVVAGVGPVDTDEILKGFEYEKGRYVLMDEEDLDAVRLETKKTFDLAQFVGACDIPPLYFDKPYYVVPQDELAEDAYRVVRDALRKSEMVGLGQLAMRGKEYLAALKPCGKGLLLETLHYEEEIRKARFVLQRDQQREGRRGSARGGAGADRAQGGALRSGRVQEPLHAGAARADQPPHQGQGAEGRDRGRGAAERRQRHRPDGGAEEEPGRGRRDLARRRGQGRDGREIASRAKKRAPAKPVRKPAARKARKSA